MPPLPQRALDHGCSRRLGVAARSGIVGRSGVRAFRLESSPQSCDHGRRALHAPLLLRLQHRIALGVRARHALPAFAARVLRAATRQVVLGRVGGVAVNEILLEVFARGRDTTGEEGGWHWQYGHRTPSTVVTSSARSVPLTLTSRWCTSCGDPRLNSRQLPSGLVTVLCDALA